MYNQLKRVVIPRYSDITIAAFVVMVMSLLFTSCSGRGKDAAVEPLQRDSLPVLETRDVVSLISDSGIIRYKIETPLWLVYDRKVPPYWSFEEGVHLESFDIENTPQASIDADTAYYYNEQKLWELRGNVRIENQQGEKFFTEQLFWNQAGETVYSDKFIRIVQPDRVITGRGFESNQSMTVYKIHKPEGIFYVEDDSSATMAGDSVQNIQNTDSLNNKP